MDDPTQPAEVSAVTSVGDALNAACTGASTVPAHVIHWAVVMDVAFSDGSRELCMLEAPNQPPWITSSMMDWMTGEAAAHAAYADDEGEEGSDDAE